MIPEETKKLRDLKEFLNSLDDAQLEQPFRIVETDRPVKYIQIFDVLKEDHINPSGEMAEPISMYSKGSGFLDDDDDWDYSDEPIVAYKGDVFFHIAE